MRWSVWQNAGVQALSGTSLALAIGCSGEPVVKEELAPMGLAAIEQVEEAAQAARRRPQSYDDRVELASSSQGENGGSNSGSEPWFFRRAGEPQPGFVTEPPRQQNLSNRPDFSNVSAEQPRVQPIAQPRPPRRGPPGGWRKAACGRG